MAKKKYKKLPKKPKAGAGVAVLKNYLERVKKVKKYNKEVDKYNKQLESLKKQVQNVTK